MKAKVIQRTEVRKLDHVMRVKTTIRRRQETIVQGETGKQVKSRDSATSSISHIFLY